MGSCIRSIPHEQFDEETRDFAQQLAEGPPLAYRDVKRTMIGEAHQALGEAIDEENRLQIHCFLSEDCGEGLNAFLEKRAPRFQGY